MRGEVKYRMGIRNLLAIIFLLFFLIQACKPPRGESSCRAATGNTGQGRNYARGFSMEFFQGYKILRVTDPWQGSRGVRFEYVLAPQPDRVPDSLGHLPLIRTPVGRVICMSTTHVAMVEALGKTETIVGISGTDYISSPTLRQRLAEGKAQDVGADQSLNYERIISLKPDVLISYGITAEVSGMVKRLGDLGIPVILNADYLENEPLGKTEWLKFMAVFYEMDIAADSIFKEVEAEYLKFRSIAEKAADRPGVMTGLPWKDSWYVPGGNSFAAAFIRDAGGDYLWKDMNSHEAAPVNLEVVFERGSSAVFWINCGNALSLEDIRQTDGRLAKIVPFRNRLVYNNTARINPYGGNDFWETGVMEPHLILADLIAIFHPELLPGHKLKYYRQLR